jgi:hypothetical protein
MRWAFSKELSRPNIHEHHGATGGRLIEAERRAAQAEGKALAKGPGTPPTPAGGAARTPGSLDGPVNFGKNFDKKVRKHIDQVRNRGPVKENTPSPGKGGTERVQEIIQQRVARGGGRATTYAGEPAVAFEDGGVTYIFRRNGVFWTILGK